MGPNEQFSLKIEGLKAHLAACVGVLCQRGHPNPSNYLSFPEALMTRVCEAQNAVRGNRPAAGVVTWDDHRLMMAATLRVCLEELERPCPSPTAE